MAKHSDFLQHIAQVFGESEATIQLTHRLLREADLLQGVRGRHAPPRTPADAATFLCWIGVSDKPSDAPAAVATFGNIVGRGKIHDVLQLPQKHTLLNGLEAVIRAEAEGRELPPYNVEFSADELNATIVMGAARCLYSLEDASNAREYMARFGKPYRVTRIFDRAFMQRLASIFADQSGAQTVEAAE